ncbi:hypothetical protein C8A00DRAFT_19351 [Chaetomidium leptoderma]|uniref:Uncharacterized protein n=1 Tax=Chaetomidium leptoderma TaxID=669021 RepID=A0AAN6ZSY1_9PEZI|nr:hypothetical protein C8A00DRAFT_19351 [Chaetomidium leptoderma]
MGSALSRCTPRSSRGGGLSETGQRMLDRQPNWLIQPSRWRPQTCDHQPVRYRTPTPYPKEGRKRIDEHLHTGKTHAPEKTLIIVAPVVVSHVEVVTPLRKHTALPPHQPHLRNQQAPLTITWEVSPRLHRFERVP